MSGCVCVACNTLSSLGVLLDSDVRSYNRRCAMFAKRKVFLGMQIDHEPASVQNEHTMEQQFINVATYNVKALKCSTRRKFCVDSCIIKGVALYTGKSIITAELDILRRLAAALREHYELSQDGGTTELHQKQNNIRNYYD